MTKESERLAEDHAGTARWKLWGPYLSERQWGTVREDYSEDGAAWEYFPHDHARSRAYRWGEDGLAGISDDHARLCFSLALWNGNDAILKERLFGLTNSEGNHGEDVKELYYYLDATPTHSYLEFLYLYPQRAFPYAELVEGNRARGIADPELEILDTGVFRDGRYFEVRVEYAKASPTDVLVRITVENRGPEQAEIHLLPQLWFRNTWSWTHGAGKPELGLERHAIVARHEKLGTYRLACERDGEVLFTDNETNGERLWGSPRRGPVKDAFHEHVIAQRPGVLRTDERGTKAAFHRRLAIPAGAKEVLRLRLANTDLASFADHDTIVDRARAEADEFYADLQKKIADPEARRIQRTALAGMIWSKQYFGYDVRQWLRGDELQPPPPLSHRHGRNHDWEHLRNADILSMPDKWEYPWFAAWDLAFHTIPLAMVDVEFAKSQLVLLTREWYMHPNGQLPAYEWAFGDVNPPVHAWAALRVFEIERERTGKGDLAFLERVFHKLLLNFTWWVNRKDASGRNIFQGGFLGLDNIGIFDRSAPLPTGGSIDQADGTSWMAMYSLNLMRIALELSKTNPVYQDIATKFFEHFLDIAEAMNNVGGQGQGLWDPEDEFFYDVLRLPDGRAEPLRVRSMVGLIPLFAVEVIEPELLACVPEFARRLRWYLDHRPDLAALVSRWNEPGRGDRRLLGLLRGHRMKRVLRRMLDETEFLSDFGIRSMSKVHEANPYVFRHDGKALTARYAPAESETVLFGGNSNWRGPIWFPPNYLVIESLRRFHRYYGDEFVIECPTGSGTLLSIGQVADELARRLTRLFAKDDGGNRPIYRGTSIERDPRLADRILFHEYFHGDTGRGAGASHQTGWTGLVAELLGGVAR